MGSTTATLQHLKVGTKEEPAGRARRAKLLRLVVETESRVKVHACFCRLPDRKWVVRHLSEIIIIIIIINVDV